MNRRLLRKPIATQQNPSAYGTHFDRLADDPHHTELRPILPCFLAALDALDAWITDGQEPAPSATIPFPADQSPEGRANTCTLAAGE